jgi:cytidylate kinase
MRSWVAKVLTRVAFWLMLEHKVARLLLWLANKLDVRAPRTPDVEVYDRYER